MRLTVERAKSRNPWQPIRAGTHDAEQDLKERSLTFLLFFFYGSVFKTCTSSHLAQPWRHLRVHKWVYEKARGNRHHVIGQQPLAALEKAAHHPRTERRRES